jgi:allantoinase
LPDLTVVSQRVVAHGGLREAGVVIENGRITRLVEAARARGEGRVLDVGDRVVMPGLVDAHVHINDPGRAEWEGFRAATGAAAAGGVTTLVDMPLNSIPPTTTTAAFVAKREAARGRLFVDCAFWGGLVPDNAAEVEPLIRAGVAGFKAFLVPSGVEEFPHVEERHLRKALRVLFTHRLPLLVHAERSGAFRSELGDPRCYSNYLASRPPASETDAIRLLVELGRETGATIHVVHLSSADALPLLREARREGLAMSVETCPHYLFFAAEDVPEGRTEFKCSPPIRERANRERLWAGLGEGTIDMIVSDHSPCAPELKGLDRGDFFRAWGGISSLQFRLPVVWTEARRRGFGLDRLAEWLCHRPAALAGLAERKGGIAPGLDADLVIFDPEASFTLEPEAMRHRHRLTPYRGQRLEGVVEVTILRGEVVYDRGLVSPSPRGEPLLLSHGPLH